MKRNTRLWVLIGFLVLMMISGFLLMGRQINVTVDGQSYIIFTRGLTVSQALRGMGIRLTYADKVDPAANTWLNSSVKQITVMRARPIVLWIDPSEAHLEINSAASTPRELLTQAGFTPSDSDSVKLNGNPLEMDDALPVGKTFVVQYTAALPLQFALDNNTSTYQTSAATVGQALWDNGVRLIAGDQLSVPFMQPLSGALSVMATSAKTLHISVDGKAIDTLSSASTVGEALAENNISLQNLDYSSPSEESTLPADGKITVVRVKLVVQEDEKVTPYTTIYTIDKTMSTSEKTVTKAGQNGITIERVMVRYENGKEASRETLSDEVIQEKVDEQVTEGSSSGNTTSSTASSTATATSSSSTGAAGTISTSSGTLSYYYSLTVYATSYSPCRIGTGSCSSETASGKTLTDGMIAVTVAWYHILKGTQIYVPGYGIGTVEDTGGGISGKQWIDLGYTDADWKQWSRNVTIYFLTPQPSGFTGSLP